MNHPGWHWALAVAALVAGHAAYGWPGVALAFTAIVFWLLLQFNRAVRVMRRAGAAPKGQVPSAVMLHSKLSVGMTMLQVLPLAGSLGEPIGAGSGGDAGGDIGGDGHEAYRWRDAGGRELTAAFANGRLASWQLSPAIGAAEDLPSS